MAVPFSRPEYSPSARRRRRSSTHPSGASPPRSNRRNSPANILASHFATGGRASNLPLGLSLESLSLTSRITFYALYEAWRLLQEVTGSLSSATTPQQMIQEERLYDQYQEPSLPESYVEETIEEHHVFIRTEEHKDLVKSCNETLSPDLHLSPPLPMIQKPISFKKNPESRFTFEESSTLPLEDWKKPSPDCIWNQLGQQICEVSSSFEISYDPQESSGATRALFESYRDLKRSVMISDLKKSKSLSSAKGPSLIIFLSYSKTALRQLLLSTLWFLLKKIL
uniref:Uncharacterized protein n=1 Tax=Lepeophtheirus salmonis TaxID=72036 RepID=A0A0K2SXK2_LEPSM